MYTGKQQNKIFYQKCKCNKQTKCYINIKYERDKLLTEYAISSIRSSYLYQGNIQELFAQVAVTYGYNCQHAQIMYDYISQLIFIPSTPIIRHVYKLDGYPISCFTNTLYHDNIYDILSQIREICLQLYEGGGSSIDLSHISNTKYNNNNTEGCINMIEAIHSYITKLNPRRSTICYYLNISHPDIEEFINIRKPTYKINKIQISAKTHIAVCINNDFMQKVINNEQWQLRDPHTQQVTKTINARQLFINLIKLRYETGEPFIYFTDNVEKYKPQVYKKLNVKIGISNLCTEIFIPCMKDHKCNKRNGVCCLGSINLDKFEQFDDKQKIDILYNCVLFLDNVLNYYINSTTKNKHNFERTIESIKRSRAIGLGFMGWHTYLQNRMIPFDSKQASEENKKIFTFIKHHIDQISIYLGAKFGDCQDNIDGGIKGRFTLKIAIAPNSHISLIAGVSPGINPIISNYYHAKTSGNNIIHINNSLKQLIQKFYKNKLQQIYVHMLNNGGSIQNIDFIQDKHKQIFKTAYEIDQKTHIQICAERNNILHGEQGQSINLFIRDDFPFHELIKIHIQAHQIGIKTLYYLFNSPVIQAQNDSYHCSSCES